MNPDNDLSGDEGLYPFMKKLDEPMNDRLDEPGRRQLSMKQESQQSSISLQQLKRRNKVELELPGWMEDWEYCCWNSLLGMLGGSVFSYFVLVGSL